MRRHPEMFRVLAHDGPAAAALLAEAALRAAATTVTVTHDNGWYTVRSDQDWLSDLTDRDPFTELIPFPELGPNAVHPEVIVTAFAATLITATSTGTRIVTGADDPPTGLAAAARLITFRMPDPS